MEDKGSIVRKLNKLNLVDGIKPFQVETHYEVIMGSFAYGVSGDTSDCDVYGFYTPPMEQIFPHTAGYIHGFGKPPQMDNGYQKHHIKLEPKEYDVALFSIIKFFNLCKENNPNMIDSLFVPSRCVIHSDEIGIAIRDNRRMFLHKGIHHKLMGYAYSQLNKVKTKKPDPDSRRYDMVQKYGYDVKFAYHVVRLVQQAEMVMSEHDLDLEKNRELLKAIRRGEWTLDELESWFKKRQDDLETLYTKSDLRYTADEAKIKELLYQCLEMKFGSLSAYFNLDGSTKVVLDKMKRIKQIIEE